jgi:hypothetical protein
MPCIKKNEEKKDITVPFFEFKREFVSHWLQVHLNKISNPALQMNLQMMMQRNHGQQIMKGRVTIASSLGSMNKAHMLVENLPRKANDYVIQDIDCFLCQKMVKELKTSYSCIQCISCKLLYCIPLSWSAFKLNALLDVMFDSDRHPTVGRPSKYVWAYSS